MNITAKDVANHAKVSVATVSYVINNGPRPVAESTRQKVMQSIEDLGYKPNVLARSLTTGRTNTVGIIIPDIRDPFFPELISGAESVARGRGYSIFLCNANRNPKLESHYVELLAQRKIDGIMIAGSRRLKKDLLSSFLIPNAVVMTQDNIAGAVAFSIDDHDGGRQIGIYLASLGHSKVRYIEGTWDQSEPYRYQGLLSGLNSAGIETEGVMGLSVQTTTVAEGRKATLELLAADKDVTALVFYNDSLALGGFQACDELGLRVPEDISIVGFDDIPEASRFRLKLTTVRVNNYQLGEQMMNKLIDLIDDLATDRERIVIPVELIIRSTCAPPRKAK